MFSLFTHVSGNCIIIWAKPAFWLHFDGAVQNVFCMLTRRHFTALTAAATLAAPAVVHSQTPRKVIIVGAGSAGMTAAYHLIRAGIDVQVLEASGRWGGRVKRDHTLANVPLDIGAEWIHDDPTILGQIVGQGETDLGVETIEYRPQTYQFWNNGKLSNFNAARHLYAEVKFYDTTWFGFFERFVWPTIQNNVRLNAAVNRIASDGAGVTVELSSGEKFEADQVLVTVPISVLKSGQIRFSNDLLPENLFALEDVVFGQGFKVFLRFAERFYPDMLFFGSRLTALSDAWDSKIYYDAAFRKPTEQNILGLFTVNEARLPRASLSDTQMIETVLDELSDIFGTQVRQHYQAGLVQNWSQEPFIQGSYSMTNNSDFDLSEILTSQQGRLFFAGEALGGDAQSTVHGAAFSAIDAVQQMMSG